MESCELEAFVLVCLGSLQGRDQWFTADIDGYTDKDPSRNTSIGHMSESLKCTSVIEK